MDGECMNLAVIGMQFGDEGKGKIVDYLAENFDVVARFSGGSNAGHTVIYNGEKIKFHILPSGVLRGKIAIMGNGMAINPKKLVEEINMIENHGINPKVFISSKAHVVTEIHEDLDSELDKLIKIGTTRQGIGPAYYEKYRRTGIRIADLFNMDVLEKKLEMMMKLNDKFIERKEISTIAMGLREYGKKIKEMVGETEVIINNLMNSGKNILFEGSQGTFLDVDFGTYPYVTSSNTTVGGIVTGLGVPPKKIDKVMGIAKAYTTRVGEGPFPTEVDGDEGDKLREKGGEYGATTGRARRVGYLDLPMLRYATMINGIEEIAITKVDVLQGYPMIKAGIKYKCSKKEYTYPPSNIHKCEVEYVEMDGWNDINDENLKKYIKLIEKETGARVTLVSYGPKREDTVKL